MSSTAAVAFRHAQWDTPWWANPNRNAGRYNRPMDVATQYWCLHPLGPTAELLRWSGRPSAADAATFRLRLWASKIETDDLVTVDFANASRFRISPDELVGEDYLPTQALADRIRSDGAPGFVAPSAALPGTEVLVLFGPRLLHPYLLEPVDPEDQVPTAHAAEATVASEVIDAVRWKGETHWALDEWKSSGTLVVWRDPPVPR